MTYLEKDLAQNQASGKLLSNCHCSTRLLFFRHHPETEAPSPRALNPGITSPLALTLDAGAASAISCAISQLP